MNGAECLLRTLVANGVRVCFMNPGTSEMQFVSALDRVPEMRAILCLFEGVCSGAADGYARMTGRPAATLLHLGPGLGNALANFHNARKARSPIVSVVGDHATAHQTVDAPLSADVPAFARTVSNSVHVLENAAGMGLAAAQTVAAALAPPGQIATLIVPADFSWSPAGDPGAIIDLPRRSQAASERIQQSAQILREYGPQAGIVLGGTVLRDTGLAAAARIVHNTSARLFADRNTARNALGRGRPFPQRITYFPEKAEAQLAGLRHLLLVEAKPPVSFFAYPGRRSTLAPEDCSITTLASLAEDGETALIALADALGCSSAVPPTPTTKQPVAATGTQKLTADSLGRSIAALLPEDAIVSDEMVSCAETIWPHLLNTAPHDFLPVTGGSIGQGLPVALGAAVACPGRKVVAIQADGGGMYTLQALWTMARCQLDVTTVILANHRYRILDIEMQRTGAEGFGPLANDMIDIGRPDLDWVKLANAMGVEASRAICPDEFSAQFREALEGRGPRLIEAII